MQIEFVAQSDRNTGFPAANPARLINLYPEPLPPGGRAAYQLRSVPGSDVWAELGGVFLRGLATVNGTLFGVADGSLWEIPSNAAAVIRGAIDDDENTVINGGDGKVTVTAGAKYYLWDGTTLTQPTPGVFSSFGSLDFLNGYTLFTERGGNRLQWSGLYDPTSLPGLSFGVVEGRAGNLSRCFVVNGNVYLFKAASHEIWAPTGLPGENAFAPLGIVGEIGLKGFNLISRTPSGGFFIGNDNRAYLMDGGTMTPFSTPAVEYDLKHGEATDCLYYEDEGHQFAVIRFRNRPAWVCDLSYGGLWHERASGLGAWSVQKAALAYGQWRIGGQGSAIWRVMRRNEDADGPLIRRAISQTAYQAGQPFTVAKVELFGNVGQREVNRVPVVATRFSRDHGATWGEERRRSFGAIGQYDRRMTWRALGQFRQFNMEVTMTDPVEMTLLSAASVGVV